MAPERSALRGDLLGLLIEGLHVWSRISSENDVAGLMSGALQCHNEHVVLRIVQIGLVLRVQIHGNDVDLPGLLPSCLVGLFLLPLVSRHWKIVRGSKFPSCHFSLLFSIH